MWRQGFIKGLSVKMVEGVFKIEFSVWAAMVWHRDVMGDPEIITNNSFSFTNRSTPPAYQTDLCSHSMRTKPHPLF